MIIDYRKNNEELNSKQQIEEEIAALNIELYKITATRKAKLAESSNRFEMFTEEELDSFRKSGFSEIQIEDLATPISLQQHNIINRLNDLTTKLREMM